MKQIRSIWFLLLLLLAFLIFDGYLMYKYTKTSRLANTFELSRIALCPDFDGDSICEKIYTRTNTNKMDELVVESKNREILITPFSMFDKEAHFTRAGISRHRDKDVLVIVGGDPRREESYQFQNGNLALTTPDEWDRKIMNALRENSQGYGILYELIQTH